MIADLTPYPAMKGSGVPWLGEVPAHWGAASVKRHYAIQLGKMLQTRPEGPADVEAPYLKARDVQWFVVRPTSGQKMWASPRDIEQFGVNSRDLLVCEGGEGGRAGIVRDISPGHIIQNALHRVRPLADSQNEFLQFVMSVVSSTGWFDAINSKATIAHFTRDKFGALGIPLPPPHEQAAIVRFLNHADRQIRRYVRAKEKLIKLLEEQKQAIVHRAVTRGLNPNVRLKPSGVQWLGEVPAHWEVKRLHQITHPDRPVMYGIVLPGPDVDDGVYIVKGGNCEPGKLRAELLSRTTFEIESRYGRSRLRAGDIVFAIRGGVGAAELVPPELAGANVTQDAARIAAGHGVDPRWLLHAVRAPIFREHVKSQVVGATVRGINICDLKRIEIVVPPLDEQLQLVNYLERATVDIVSAAERAHREIVLLREYRTRLIAEVVTGKLDVREAAARLPDEAAEPETLDEAPADSDGDDAGELPEEPEA